MKKNYCKNLGEYIEIGMKAQTINQIKKTRKSKKKLLRFGKRAEVMMMAGNGKKDFLYILLPKVYNFSNNMNNISSAIKNRSINLPQNSLFSIKDFTALGAYKSVKVILTRFEKEHLIKRELDGLYSKPEYSEFLQEFVAIPIDDIAIQLAKIFSWHI